MRRLGSLRCTVIKPLSDKIDQRFKNLVPQIVDPVNFLRITDIVDDRACPYIWHPVSA